MAFITFFASMFWYLSQKTLDMITTACIMVIYFKVFPLFTPTPAALWTRAIRHIARDDPAPEPVQQLAPHNREEPVDQEVPVFQEEEEANQRVPEDQEVPVNQQAPPYGEIVDQQGPHEIAEIDQQLLRTVPVPYRFNTVYFRNHDREYVFPMYYKLALNQKSITLTPPVAR